VVVAAAAQAPVAAFGMSKQPGSSAAGSSSNVLLRSKGLPMPPRSATRQPHEKLLSFRTRTAMSLSGINFVPRGGAIVAPVIDAAKNWSASPSSLFNSSLGALALATFLFKVIQKASSSDDGSSDAKKPQSVKDLQIKFLSVFWLLRCADWLQGPYFYEVYASKVFNGVPASLALVSQLFLTGFASTALFGPLVGKALDQYGRKKGTLAFAVIYALGAFSTKSPLLQVLFLGRILSGIGTSLLFSAPESWLVGEAQKSGDDPDGSYLGETFGLVSK
jgi:MFS transporter, MFS domain-containing protein family, molybdate-anion transporter